MKMKIDWMEKYLTEAEGLIYNNQIEQGLEILNDLLYDEPGYGRLHNHIGWAYMYYTSDIAKAELHLTMAIRFNEAHAAPYLHMGNLCLRTERYGEALEYLSKGITKENANKIAFLESTAHVYEMKREYTKAIKAYKEATLVSMAGFEINNLAEAIKRCQKKRLVHYFTF
jgi:tetratricopeptide (TPR) repeat protein